MSSRYLKGFRLPVGWAVGAAASLGLKHYFLYCSQQWTPSLLLLVWSLSRASDGPCDMVTARKVPCSLW